MQIKIELLQDCANNDRIAQKKLYEFCYRIFMASCMRFNTSEEDARFALNTAFIKIISGLGNCKLEELNFIPWAKRIVSNVLIDEYRKKKTQQTYFIGKETEAELDFYSEKANNEAEGNFEYEHLLSLVEELPETHAVVFKLYVLENFSHKDISEELDMSIGTSKWHLSIARKLLREKLTLLEQQFEKRLVI